MHIDIHTYTISKANFRDSKISFNTFINIIVYFFIFVFSLFILILFLKLENTSMENCNLITEIEVIVFVSNIKLSDIDLENALHVLFLILNSHKTFNILYYILFILNFINNISSANKNIFF